jgi:hypothetical protein
MAQRRKPAPTKSIDTFTLLEEQQQQQSEPSNKANTSITAVPAAEPAIAKVRRKTCGTGPFDKNWLNMDCCGLFCALSTYGLHAFGVYAVCVVLLPPWMSLVDDQGIRSPTTMGQFIQATFCTVAALAVISHYKAMTTDPGAVPPDAKPLPDPEDSNDTTSAAGDTDPLMVPPHRVRKLCRRCKAYKPSRAHHCSICRRCVTKMDHHVSKLTSV